MKERRYTLDQDGNLTPTYRPFVGHAYALPNPYNGAAPAPCFPRVVNRG